MRAKRAKGIAYIQLTLPLWLSILTNTGIHNFQKKTFDEVQYDIEMSFYI